MEKVSLLMKDSSEGDSQKETMIDFILSWTLRRCNNTVKRNLSFTNIAERFLAN
mgnify:CR=1 FL=1